MSKYSYTAIAPDGQTISGVQSAKTVTLARTALLNRELQPVRVAEKKSVLQFEITRKKVPRKDLMHFTRQLAVFVRAGIPILDALDVIGEETTNKLLKQVLIDMIESLRQGETFARAAAAHSSAFAPFYIGILHSAELTGNLDTVLDQLADYVERDLDARKRLTSAMVYPSVVMATAVVTVVILVAFVLPRFQVFFKSLNAKLPLPTRMLLGFSSLLSQWWPVLAGFAGLSVVLLFVGIRTTRGRDRLDAILLRLPVVGDLIRHSILERLCRVLASMTSAGVPLPESMAVASEACNNAVYRKGLNGVREAMIRGEGLAAPLAATGLLPGAARQMVKVGEETGTLGEQLGSAAKYFDRELDYKIKNFTSLFEPATIVFVGVVVGFVAIALVSAMYGIYRQVKIA
jgi:type IV pilus assembly protein PilC